jgi:hypothetical protein
LGGTLSLGNLELENVMGTRGLLIELSRGNLQVLVGVFFGLVEGSQTVDVTPGLAFELKLFIRTNS